MIPNYFVAEYSIEQNCFHIEQLTDLIKVGQNSAIHKIPNDYQLIGVFETHTEAHEFIEKSRPMIQGQEYADKFKEKEETE